MIGRRSGAEGGSPARGAERVPVVTVAVAVFDCGPAPAWHAEGGRFGAWRRYEAELDGDAAVRELGESPWEAVRRLICMHRGLLERRWSA